MANVDRTDPRGAGMTPLALAGALLLTCSVARATDLTFLGWADPHVNYIDGSADHCAGHIAALNSMAGRAWPTSIGGTIGAPSFIICGGDMTDLPSTAAIATYDTIVNSQLAYPTYDVMGNHDFGGLDYPTDHVKNWFLARYGQYGASASELSYSFNRDGVHFTMLDSFYDDTTNNPAQYVTDQALAWLRSDLAAVDDRAPVVVVTHLCRDAILNLDDFVGALSGKNILMILGGHYETPAVQTYGGYTFVRMDGPRSRNPQALSAFRITDDRLVSAVWNIETNSWMSQYTIDTPIQTPEPASSTLILLGALAAAFRRSR